MANKCKCNLYSYRHMRWVFFFKYFCKLEKGTWDRKYKYILISSSIDLFEVIIFLGQWSSLISLACFSVASYYWLLNVGPMTRYKFCNVRRKIAKILYFFCVVPIEIYSCDLGTDKTIVQTWSTLYNV